MKHLVLCIALLAPLAAQAHNYQDMQIDLVRKGIKDKADNITTMVGLMQQMIDKHEALEKRVKLLEQKLKVKTNKK